MKEPNASTSAAPGASVFYRFEDAQGRVHIVDSWSAVPESLRGTSQRIEIGARPRSEPGSSGSPASLAALDWTSFGVGFASACLLAIVLFGLRGRFGPATKLGLFAAAAALLAGSYFALLRRETGRASEALSSPSRLIDDARKAVDAMDARNQEQERVLRNIEREAR